jgi:AcrR family transcriptional regulator
MPRLSAEPRPYLRAGERRKQLLAAAATIVGREGIGSLTVAAVAVEAGVSRQWVYEHFSDIGDLYRALLLDRFAALDALVEDAKLRLTGPELATFAGRALFTLVPADRKMLRALVGGAGWNRPELMGVESELRERMIGRWTGFVDLAGHDDVERRALIWAILNAAFGLADQIERESLSLESAMVLLGRLVAPFTVPPATGHRVRRRAGRVDKGPLNAH